MSVIRLYLDEDSMHHGVVGALRVRAVDVLTTLEAGRASQDDQEQLAFSTQEGRVIFSSNLRDFCRLHAKWLADGREHAGIVVVYRQRYSVGEQVRRLLRLIEARTLEEMKNQLEFL